jgi:predicted outer membrane repeat protein
MGQVVFKNCTNTAVVVDITAANRTIPSISAFNLGNMAFTNNSGGKGGALRVQRGQVTCSMCTFMQNTADAGAAVYVAARSSLSLASSVFIDNT